MPLLFTSHFNQSASSAAATLFQESLRKLSESLVTLALSTVADSLDERPQSLLAPVVSSGALRAPRVARSRSLEQGFGGGLVLGGIAAGRKGVAFSRITPSAGIFIHECTRHLVWPRLESINVAAFTPLSRDLQMKSCNRSRGGSMTQESFEEQQEALDPHRREERNAAASSSRQAPAEGRAAHWARDSAQLDDLMTAVDRVQAARDRAGGTFREHALLRILPRIRSSSSRVESRAKTQKRTPLASTQPPAAWRKSTSSRAVPR